MDNVQKHNNCANMWAYQTITHNPCPHTNAKLLLLSRMDYTMKSLLCKLVLVLNNDDITTTPASLNECSGPWWDVSRRTLNLMEAILRTYYKCTISAIIHILDAFGHILIWIFFPVFVCGTLAQSSSTTFNFTLYSKMAVHKGTFLSVEMRHTNLTGAEDKLLHNSTMSDME